MAFQAKDIQEILRIPKIRYEYLARKIGIKPDIEQGEGTGKAHKYSFKNLMEFAISERCSLNGFSMKQIKFLLKIVYKHANSEIFNQPKWPENFQTIKIKDSSSLSKKEIVELKKWILEKEKAFIKFEIWFIGHPGGGLFAWEGKEIDLCYFYTSKNKINKNLSDYYSFSEQLTTNPESIDDLRKGIRIDTQKMPLAKVMNSFDACIHVNIGKIRDELSSLINLRPFLREMRKLHKRK